MKTESSDTERPFSRARTRGDEILADRQRNQAGVVSDRRGGSRNRAYVQIERKGSPSHKSRRGKLIAIRNESGEKPRTRARIRGASAKSRLPPNASRTVNRKFPRRTRDLRRDNRNLLRFNGWCRNWDSRRPDAAVCSLRNDPACSRR